LVSFFFSSKLLTAFFSVQHVLGQNKCLQVTVFSTRLFSLRTVKLAGCPRVGQGALRAIVGRCAATLASIDLSRCDRVDSDCLGWIAGTQVGYRGRHPGGLQGQ
jgi:hypothetical protein